MIDGGLIVGYLTAALVRGGKRLADRKIDALLDRLTAVVMERMGMGPIDELAADPRDERRQRDLGLRIDGAASANRAFARELAEIAERLDRAGGRRMLNQVYAEMSVQAFDHGVAIGGDFNLFHAPDPSDYSGAPGWVKLCIVVGAVLAIAGMGLFGYTLFTGIPEIGEPGYGEVPRGIVAAGAVFFAGFVLLAAASIGRGLSRRD